MLREMDSIDSHYVDCPFEPIERDPDHPQKGRQPQASMKSLLNFRDYKGRTPLHVAAIFRNKAALETLLYLGANPLIEDGSGYRPIDYVDSGSPFADHLRSWMSRNAPPVLVPWGQSAPDLSKSKAVQESTTPTSGLSLTEIKALSAESL